MVSHKRPLAPPPSVIDVRAEPRAVARANFVYNLLNQSEHWQDQIGRWHRIADLTNKQRDHALESLITQSNTLAIQYSAAERFNRTPRQPEKALTRRIETRLSHVQDWITGTPLYLALCYTDKEWKHGGDSSTIARKCPCRLCRSARTRAARKRKQDRIKRLEDDPSLAVHGEPTTYDNWGCRCIPCKRGYAKSRETKALEAA